MSPLINTIQRLPHKLLYEYSTCQVSIILLLQSMFLEGKLMLYYIIFQASKLEVQEVIIYYICISNSAILWLLECEVVNLCILIA